MGPERASLTRGSGRGSVLPAQTRSVAPEPLEVVVRALLGTEYVHHDVDVVEEPPPRSGFAFATHRMDAEPVPDRSSMLSITVFTCRWVPAEQMTK